MKRIVLILFACAVIVTAFSACNSGNPAPTAAPSVSPTSEPVPTASPTVTPSVSPTPTAAPAPTPEVFKFTKENMPRIDGSTANIPLISAVRSVLLGEPREDDISVSGTDNAYVNLINGKADILLVYAPAQSSLEYAKQMNVELEMAPIGRDALVFLINKKNPVNSLTHQQLVDIYSGKTTNWKEVGGNDAEIIAYQRQLVSGSQTMMNKLVMKGTPMAEAPAIQIIGTMGGLVDAVAVYDGAENAIGYNVYYYVSRMKLDENIKLLAVEGVEPSNETISSGEYPFVNDFYAVIRADAPAGSPERILFEWMQSEAGQQLVAHEGYVAIR